MARRASDILAALSSASLGALARAHRVEGDEPAALLAAMRGPEVAERLRRACESALMLEDLALLCANPFDPVSTDELVEAAPFEELGLIVPAGEATYEVNVDMALSALRGTPAEFGFAATLLARLDGEDLALVRSAVGVGPRPTRLDAVLDVAETCVEDASLMRQIAHLRAADRKVLYRAIELGELPDDVESIPPEAPPPLVTLDPGPAGKRGLVFWIEHEAREMDARPVVPLETLPRLAELLDQVPPRPDVVERQTSRRRSTNGATRIRKPKPTPRPAQAEPAQQPLDPLAAPAALFRRSQDDRVVDPVISRIGDASTQRAGAPRRAGDNAFRGGRAATVIPAGAIVDLESTRIVESARRDDELGDAILDVVAGTILILKPGVDPRDWAERCALRFGL